MGKNHKDLFSVALVGRPNVGKSSLFNVLCQKRLALVKHQPGVTRDIRRGVAKWWGKEFFVCDTGGWTSAEDTISKAIKQKLQVQLKDFDFLIFVCDVRQELTADDKSFFSIIRSIGKPFLVALNKCDSDFQEEMEFYGLGVDKFFKISCEHKIGISPIIEAIYQKIDDLDTESEGRELSADLLTNFSITVVGKPNVGKSSLVNRILKREQQLVSPVPGTTTDTLSFNGNYKDFEFRIYDTAGIRRKTKLNGELEGLTMIKALETIDKAEFILIVIDATDKPSLADTRLIERCNEKNKPFLIVVNKWDLARKTDNLFNKDTFKKDLIKKFHFLKSFEVVFVSALTSSGIDKLFKKLHMLKEKMSKHIGTGELNRFFKKALKLTPAPFYNNKQVKFYYITQTKQSTPSFLCFANYPKGVTPSYRRFLENRIREEFDFDSVPIRVLFLPKDSVKRGNFFND